MRIRLRVHEICFLNLLFNIALQIFIDGMDKELRLFDNFNEKVLKSNLGCYFKYYIKNLKFEASNNQI